MSEDKKNWFQRLGANIGRFFAVSNDVNENTVMGFICFWFAMWAAFVPSVGADKFWGLIGLTAAFFAVNITKR